MSNTEHIKQAAMEICKACPDFGPDTVICSSENFYIVFGDVFAKSKTTGNNFGTRVCSKKELLSHIKNKKGA